MNIFRMICNLMVVLLPWRLKRLVLVKCYGYDIAKTAHIGIAYIFPSHLKMGENACIAHFTVAIHLENLIMGANSSIGRSNWITGYPINSASTHFKWQKDRKCELVIGEESAITNNHHIDCTNQITIGHHVTIAGYRSQLLTHSIDVYEGRQGSAPISIGDYTFVATGAVILGGSQLPAYSLLAAGAVLQKSYEEEWTIYAGVPAKPVKSIPKTAKYFSREKGYVI